MLQCWQVPRESTKHEFGSKLHCHLMLGFPLDLYARARLFSYEHKPNVFNINCYDLHIVLLYLTLQIDLGYSFCFSAVLLALLFI
jgi:hypothetical protein